ncbi:MAG: RsmB/NOP family class I SAM-dependent RNA methyltransferase [Ruminococcus sp.]|jgi:NOL1/NOP2/sun family putative RNA methylase
MNIQLPEKYVREMQSLLGSEFEDYIDSLKEPVSNGLRVNTLKTDPEEMQCRLPFSLEKIPWISDGFFCLEEERPAKSPWYQAGLYYLQEPSAMTPADRLPVEKGDLVLDLCAAPGGKSTRIASSLQQTGMLYANDISNSRAKALLKNLEMWGAANICVMSEEPKKLAAYYPEYFDKILIDAPCSGEGMFHRDPSMVRDWERRGPDYYSDIQKDLLWQGSKMLKPGGMMLYSTCTFSRKENEDNIAWILGKCPELFLREIRPYEGFARGIAPLKECVRIFPQKMEGEGHFLALLEKKGEKSKETGGKADDFRGDPLPEDAGRFLSQIRWEKRISLENTGSEYLRISGEFFS